MVPQAQNPGFRAFIEGVFAALPFMMALGARLGRIEPGEAEIELTVQPDHLQHGGSIYGGVIGEFADNAAGAAAASVLPAGQATVTAEYRISFLAPATGQQLVASGSVVKTGRSLIHIKSDVTVVSGYKRVLVATSLSSMCRS